MRVAIPCLLLVFMIGCTTLGWTQPVPTFEVAAVRVNHTGSGNSAFPVLNNGRLTATNVTLLSLLQAAYGLSEARIIGPEWLKTERFDVLAKAPAGASDTDIGPLLQSLLTDRFWMAVHIEKKELSVFHMVVAKGGVRMSLPESSRPSEAPPNRGGSMLVGAGTMSDIASRISLAAGRPVLDRTGLTGRYRFLLIFTPTPPTVQPSESAPPDLLTAVQEQLGLKLESKKEAVEVLVVDHADRVPKAN